MMLLSGRGATAAVWNVSADGTGDVPTIQDAYDQAAPGDLIVLAPGTYTDSITRTIQGHSTQRTTTAVAFIGPGVDITSSGGAAVTFVEGLGDRHGFLGVDVGGVHISGITFTHCARSGGELWGGGLMFHRSAPIVENCRFVDNEGWAAGGVFLSQGSGAILRFNVFVRNFGGDLAGAVELFQHTGATIAFNTFVDNWTTREGGALLVNSSTATVSNNVFSGNSAPDAGGAIACMNSASATGACNLFWANQAPINECGAGLDVGVNENVEADPLFCDAASDDFMVYVNSPAASGVGPCAMRGALGVGCGTVSVEPVSWGAAKSLYR